MADRTCSHPACNLEGGLYPSGRWCPEYHAPHLQAGTRPPGAEAYCAPGRCYCGTCPWWKPGPVRGKPRTRLPEGLELPDPEDVVAPDEVAAMKDARTALAAMVETDLDPARARALRERNRRTAR